MNTKTPNIDSEKSDEVTSAAERAKKIKKLATATMEEIKSLGKDELSDLINEGNKKLRDLERVLTKDVKSEINKLEEEGNRLKNRWQTMTEMLSSKKAMKKAFDLKKIKKFLDN